jgi:hypothetical protein
LRGVVASALFIRGAGAGSRYPGKVRSGDDSGGEHGVR